MAEITQSASLPIVSAAQCADVLRDLLAHEGDGLLSEPRRLRAFLSDRLPDYRREIRAITVAAEEGLPTIVQSLREVDPIFLGQLATRLEQNYGLSEQLATWTVAVFVETFHRRIVVEEPAPEPAKPVAPEAAQAQPAPLPTITPDTEPSQPLAPDTGPATGQTSSPTSEPVSKIRLVSRIVIASLIVGTALIIIMIQMARVGSKSTADVAPVSSLKIGNGQYHATRGWAKSNSGKCGTFSSFDVDVQDGIIKFSSGGFDWSGTINQTTGDIDISANNGLTITGQTDSATMTGSHSCRDGYFRFLD